MTVDELQEFLSNNVTSELDTEIQNAMMKDSESMDFGSFVEKWDDVLKKNSSGWYRIRNQAKPLEERIRRAFGSDDRKNPFAQDKNYIEDIYNDNFKDVPREQFDETLKNMRKYWEDEKKYRVKQSDRKKRELEVEDWSKGNAPWYRTYLTSDYEKQRYIEDPNKALFGEQAPDFAPETRWGSIADFGLGTAGTVADIATGAMKKAGPLAPLGYASSILLGPTIRFTRDAGHKIFNSPYQKDWSDILTERGADVGLNAGIEGFTNLRALSRFLKNTNKGPITTFLDNKELISDTKKMLENFPNSSELKNISNTDLYSMIDNMENNEIKQSFKKYAPNPLDIDRAGLADEIDRANKLVNLYENPNIRESMKLLIDNDYNYLPRIGERPYEASILSEKLLSKPQKVGATFYALTDGGITHVSTPALKVSKRIVDPKSKVSEDVEGQKNWIKNNFNESWSKGIGKPTAKSEQIVKDAYTEWCVENGLPIPEFAQDISEYLSEEFR